jgi:hypothetical protein
MTSKYRYRPDAPITVETFDWAFDRMAVIMFEAPDGGERYLPIWRRLQSERQLLLENAALLESAQRRAFELTKAPSRESVQVATRRAEKILPRRRTSSVIENASNREIGNAWTAYLLADLHENWPARCDFALSEIIAATGMSSGTSRKDIELFMGLMGWLTNNGYIQHRGTLMDGTHQMVELTALGHAVLGGVPESLDKPLGDALKNVTKAGASEAGRATIAELVGLVFSMGARLLG